MVWGFTGFTGSLGLTGFTVFSAEDGLGRCNSAVWPQGQLLTGWDKHSFPLLFYIVLSIALLGVKTI